MHKSGEKIFIYFIVSIFIYPFLSLQSTFAQTTIIKDENGKTVLTNVLQSVANYSWKGKRQSVPLAGLDKRKSAYQSLIIEASKKYNLPYGLIVAVITAESEFYPKAVSSAGAMGLMQLMPETAEYLGVKDPFDPAQNIDGGCKYLREMIDTFNGDLKLALAAYNAGPDAVRRYKGVPPYNETISYIQKINSMYPLNNSTKSEIKIKKTKEGKTILTNVH